MLYTFSYQNYKISIQWNSVRNQNDLKQIDEKDVVFLSREILLTDSVVLTVNRLLSRPDLAFIGKVVCRTSVTLKNIILSFSGLNTLLCTLS